MGKDVKEVIERMCENISDLKKELYELKQKMNITLSEEVDFKVMRDKYGATIRQVSKDTGISEGYISQIETGKNKNPSHKIVVKLLLFYYEWEKKI